VRPRGFARRKRDQVFILFARKDIQEIARFITTESVPLYEHFRRIPEVSFAQNLLHLSRNLSFREEQWHD